MTTRFTPDSWLDAILRPIAMAAPDAGVYMEFGAPDLRFAAIVALAAGWLFLVFRKRHLPNAVLYLLGYCTLAFTVWLVTSGNGRYFLPFILIAGPLCIALIRYLPMTQGFRCALAVTMVAMQGFVIYQNDPWHWWGLVSWREAPFFGVELDRRAAEIPATYVTLSSISYSVVAPQFPAASRWINLASIQKSADRARAREFLATAKGLTLLVPSVAGYSNPDGLPNKELVASVNVLLAPHQLAVAADGDCRLLPSKGLAGYAGKSMAVSAGPKGPAGFWLCELQYPALQEPLTPAPGLDEVDKVFEQLEVGCPRFLQRGDAHTQRIAGGAMRQYPSSDFKIYVFDDGQVYYKYWRALNAEFVGATRDVLSGKASMDCNNIRGRTGLPWKREI